MQDQAQNALELQRKGEWTRSSVSSDIDIGLRSANAVVAHRKNPTGSTTPLDDRATREVYHEDPAFSRLWYDSPSRHRFSALPPSVHLGNSDLGAVGTDAQSMPREHAPFRHSSPAIGGASPILVDPSSSVTNAPPLATAGAHSGTAWNDLINEMLGLPSEGYIHWDLSSVT